MMTSPIRPPFTEETALAKVQAAEDAWKTRDPEVVAKVLLRGFGLTIPDA